MWTRSKHAYTHIGMRKLGIHALHEYIYIHLYIYIYIYIYMKTRSVYVWARMCTHRIMEDQRPHRTCWGTSWSHSGVGIYVSMHACTIGTTPACAYKIIYMYVYINMLFRVAGCATNVWKRNRRGPQVCRCAGGEDIDDVCFICMLTHVMNIYVTVVCAMSKTADLAHRSYACVYQKRTTHSHIRIGKFMCYVSKSSKKLFCTNHLCMHA